MIVANSGIQAHTSSLLLNDITNGFCVLVSVASVGQTHARPCRLVHKCSTLSSPRSFSADQGPNKWQPDKKEEEVLLVYECGCGLGNERQWNNCSCIRDREREDQANRNMLN